MSTLAQILMGHFHILCLCVYIFPITFIATKRHFKKRKAVRTQTFVVTMTKSRHLGIVQGIETVLVNFRTSASIFSIFRTYQVDPASAQKSKTNTLLDSVWLVFCSFLKCTNGVFKNISEDQTTKASFMCLVENGLIFPCCLTWQRLIHQGN